MPEVLIGVRDLRKVFRQGFMRRRVEAVKAVSFEVRQGDIFGFLGPNGAGKTTTIKMLAGLIAPTSGSATIFGHPIPSAKAMERVGFMPENPYVYPYLTPIEFVEMCGRLSGLSGQEGPRPRPHRARAGGHLVRGRSSGASLVEGHVAAHRAGRGAGRRSRAPDPR